MKNQVQGRIRALQRELKKLELDAAVIYDRENLIYFAGIEDLEAGSLVVPAEGEPALFCLWLDAEHLKELCGIKNIIPYYFPKDNVSDKTAQFIADLGISKPKLGFTRYFISLKDYQSLVRILPGVEIGDIAQTCYEIRSIKSEKEIEYIKKASEFLKYGMEAAINTVKPGVKETDILAEADYAMKKAGSEGASFRMQVLTHDRQMQVHPYAGDYIIESNQPVVIHLGSSYKGYVSKMCRTVFLGNVNEESVKIYKTLIEAQKVAVKHLVPGTTANEVFEAVNGYIEDKGYKNMFLDYIGYGVGIRQSEFYPIIGKGMDHKIEADMIVDVLLPTIYKPKVGGPRLTDTIHVGEEECTYLTEYKREPIFV